jgi:hypothetical protein
VQGEDTIDLAVAHCDGYMAPRSVYLIACRIYLISSGICLCARRSGLTLEIVGGQQRDSGGYYRDYDGSNLHGKHRQAAFVVGTAKAGL